MHTFQTNVLIQFFVSSTCLEDHVFIITKTFCTCSLYGMFFVHDLSIEHIPPPAGLFYINA